MKKKEEDNQFSELLDFRFCRTKKFMLASNAVVT